LGNSYIEWAEKISEGKIDENKVKKGIFYLNQALNINSEYYLAHYNLGYAYLKLGDIDRAA
jgi:tetratricopeptide (TPR) repeat protein